MILSVFVVAFIVALYIFRPDPEYPKWATSLACSLVAALVSMFVAVIIAAIPLFDIEKDGQWRPVGDEITYTVAEGSQIAQSKREISFIAATESGLEPVEIELKEDFQLETRKSESSESRVIVTTEERSWGYWITPWESFVQRTAITLEN